MRRLVGGIAAFVLLVSTHGIWSVLSGGDAPPWYAMIGMTLMAMAVYRLAVIGRL